MVVDERTLIKIRRAIKEAAQAPGFWLHGATWRTGIYHQSECVAKLVDALLYHMACAEEEGFYRVEDLHPELKEAAEHSRKVCEKNIEKAYEIIEKELPKICK